MNPIIEHQRNISRRQLLGQAGTGIGAAALASLLGEDAKGSGVFSSGDSPASGNGADGEDSRPSPGLPDLPHFFPKAKRVIYLLMNGGPPHLDMFDPKPGMKKFAGQQLPDSILKGRRFSTMTQGQKDKAVLPSITTFRQYGDCGAPVCNFLPHTASIVDDITFIKSMHTTQVNHAPAITFFLTGGEQPGRPSMGSWLTYGLGAEASDVPGFVVMTSRDKEASCGQIFYDFYWSSGFLPTKFQGVKFRGTGDPVLYLSDPKGMDRKTRRLLLDGLGKLNAMHHQQVGDPEIATRIAQYEMAYKMQASVPEMTDLTRESKATLDMYGPDVHRQGSFAYNCLMARKLAEKGTRFIQLFHAGWDHHNNIMTQFEIQCRDTDQPAAALVKDLKQRGLLEDTLVVWSGEFGRTPFKQKRPNNDRIGRDHHPYVFTSWLAGGGIKQGHTYGSSDDFAFNVADKPVNPHDFQATILHLLGIDHERLTYKFQGRHFRLTDVHGEVVQDVIA
jgi:hypothetical protein